VKLLREVLREILAVRAFRALQVRDRGARNTARKHADRHLTRLIHGVVFPQTGFDGFATSEKWSLMVVTAHGHHPGYLRRICLKPWIPEWISGELVSASDLSKLNLLSARYLSKPDIEHAPEPNKT
jgi:hypothetical protein